MKAKNNREIIHGYLKFTIFFVVGVGIGILIIYSFIATSKKEISCIEKKSKDYDLIYHKQTAFVSKIDSLYNYMSLLNSSERINDLVLQSVISTRKMDFIKELKVLDFNDAKLYYRLSDQINKFLSVKDSIRMKKVEEELVRSDLLRCVQDNKKTKRKLSLGGKLIEK